MQSSSRKTVPCGLGRWKAESPSLRVVTEHSSDVRRDFPLVRYEGSPSMVPHLRLPSPTMASLSAEELSSPKYLPSRMGTLIRLWQPLMAASGLAFSITGYSA